MPRRNLGRDKRRIAVWRQTPEAQALFAAVRAKHDEARKRGRGDEQPGTDLGARQADMDIPPH